MDMNANMYTVWLLCKHTFLVPRTFVSIQVNRTIHI